MKIAVYAISKNEEKFVERFCDSAKNADVILIADTGSTDNTVSLATNCGATVHEILVNHNGRPRNIVLAYDTPEEYVPPLRPASHPYHGSTIGRYANRIKHGKFFLNNQEY